MVATEVKIAWRPGGPKRGKKTAGGLKRQNSVAGRQAATWQVFWVGPWQNGLQGNMGPLI